MVSVGLPPDTHTVAKKYAKDKGKPLSTLMRDVLAEAIDKKNEDDTKFMSTLLKRGLTPLEVLKRYSSARAELIRLVPEIEQDIRDKQPLPTLCEIKKCHINNMMGSCMLGLCPESCPSRITHRI